ncbi:MAG: hypothetical protein LBC14_02470, partial [Desulfovibrio sp.]|nr:hypothetical protein [Desulfovibrio sp.]
DRHTGIRRQSRLSHGAFLDVYAPASACRNNDAAGTARTSLRTEILNEDSPAEKGTRADDAARARHNPAAGLDFPPLVKGDRVTRLRFRAPDPDKGRISYRGTPVDADADGVVDVGGEDFDPARISFSPSGHWTGTVRLTFVAAIKNFFTKEEREAAGSVCFTVAAPPPARNGVLASIRAGAHGNTRDDAHASSRSRRRPQAGSTPADKSRTACLLPDGRDYRQGMSGFAGRQTGIPPTGELAGREGNFDESARVSRLCRPGGAARCDSCLQGGNEEVIRTVPRGGTLHGHFPFAAVGVPGGVLFAAVSVGDEDAVKVGAEGVVRRGRFGVLRVADDGEFVYEADGDGAEPVWDCFTWSLYGADGRMEKGRLYIAVAGY